MQPDPNEQARADFGSDRKTSSSSDPEKPRHKGVRAVVWIVLLLVFGAGFFLVMRQRQQTQSAPTGRRGAAGGTVNLTATAAQKGNIGVYVDAIGTVSPVYTSSITSQVNGIVTAVHYTEGQMVKKGDALIDIDPRPYEATLLQAQGALDRDQGLLAQAQMDLARYQAAWARNAIQKQQLDDQEKLVEQDKGTVKNDQGTVQYDQIQVQFCHIVSPITGRVGLRLVDPGNVVTANGATVLAVITQITPITVVFTVAEDSLGEIVPQLRKRTKLSVDAFDRGDQKKIASGTLLTLDNLIDTTTGTVKARAQFANKDSSLFPNQFVNARLLTKTLTGVTLIPTAAVQHNGQAAFVYAIDPGTCAKATDGCKAHMRTITVGVTAGQTAQVTGINPGETLATSSFDKLQDGSPVAISTGAAASGATGTSGNASGGTGSHSHGKGKNGSTAPSGSAAP